MKRIVNSRVATMIVAVMLLSPVYAQDIAMNSKIIGIPTFSPVTESQSRQIQQINDVNSKVLRSFYKSYGEVQDANWFKTDNGFAVSFNNKGMKTNVFYRNNGTEDYKIKYYFEEQLPTDVRHLVKTNFYDYSITQVSEVIKDNETGYFVKIESKYAIKSVRVIGDEFEIVEDMTKK